MTSRRGLAALVCALAACAYAPGPAAAQFPKVGVPGGGTEITVPA